MFLCEETGILIILLISFVTNMVGMIIPVWYRKFHHHSIANQTSPLESACHMYVNIQEGLWQRHCDERTGSNCVEDFDEWCDQLDYPGVNDFVISIEVLGNLILLFAVVTIIRSKCITKQCNIEMVGAEAGLGGVMMLVGVFVYAYADSEVGYTTNDLHAGWGLCLASGGVCILTFMYCVNLDIRRAKYNPYFPIDNSYDNGYRSRHQSCAIELDENETEDETMLAL